MNLIFSSICVHQNQYHALLDIVAREVRIMAGPDAFPANLIVEVASHLKKAAWVDARARLTIPMASTPQDLVKRLVDLLKSEPKIAGRADVLRRRILQSSLDAGVEWKAHQAPPRGALLRRKRAILARIESLEGELKRVEGLLEQVPAPHQSKANPGKDAKPTAHAA